MLSELKWYMTHIKWAKKIIFPIQGEVFNFYINGREVMDIYQKENKKEGQLRKEGVFGGNNWIIILFHSRKKQQ